MSVSPPKPKLPSLNALRAFEASARLGGFSQAAEELQVTPGAVAAQVKSLEEDIGAALFVREAKGVRLTPLGERALPDFVEAFDAIGQAVRNLKRDAAPRKIRIAALPALAQLWLGPRLPVLRDKLPGIDVSVTAMETPPNLKRVPFDICLFYADGIPSSGVRLANDRILPVCAPDLAETLKRPEDLKKAVCLTDTAWANDWTLWARRAMPDLPFAPIGPSFSLYALAVQEALNGAGVLMAHEALIADHLNAGALVAPFDQSVDLDLAITLWIQPGVRHDEMVRHVLKALTDLG